MNVKVVPVTTMDTCLVTALPTLLLAVHLQVPSCCSPILVKGKTTALLQDTFVQLMTGGGLPSAEQFRVTLEPAFSVWLLEMCVRTGGSTGKRQQQNISYSQGWFALDGEQCLSSQSSRELAKANDYESQKEIHTSSSSSVLNLTGSEHIIKTRGCRYSLYHLLLCQVWCTRPQAQLHRKNSQNLHFQVATYGS